MEAWISWLGFPIGALIAGVALRIGYVVTWNSVYGAPATVMELEWIEEECQACAASREYIRQALDSGRTLTKWDWLESRRLRIEMENAEELQTVEVTRHAAIERIKEIVHVHD